MRILLRLLAAEVALLLLAAVIMGLEAKFLMTPEFKMQFWQSIVGPFK